MGCSMGCVSSRNRRIGVLGPAYPGELSSEHVLVAILSLFYLP